MPRDLSLQPAPHLLAWLLACPPQVRGELLRERVQQLEAQEARFAESLVSLQFQKAARMATTLWAYTALLSIQDLLLEELSESETLTKLACEQILGSHSPVSAGLGAGEGRGMEPAPHLRVPGFILVHSPVSGGTCPAPSKVQGHRED